MLIKLALYLLEIKRKRIKKEISKLTDELDCATRMMRAGIKNIISKKESDVTKLNSAIKTIKTVENYFTI